MLRRSATHAAILSAAILALALGPPAFAQAGAATLLAGPPDQEVLIESDTLVYGWEAQVLQLEGHVVARRGDGLVRAQSGTLDRAHGVLALQGGVLGVQGKDVFLADEAVIDLNTRVADLRHATLYLKEKPANPDAPTAGKNALVLHGTRVRKLKDGSYTAEEVRLTPCDCAGEPDYELLAHTAHLEGDRAHLTGTRLEFLGATLPLFPLSLPLTQRQWGLLGPELGFGSSYWFTYAQPIFLPLGQSNDLTLTPGYYTGGTTHLDPNNQPSQGSRAIKGPRLGLEWRYAPVQGTAGSLDFNLYDDRDQSDSKAAGPPFAGETGTSAGRGLGGVRGLAHWNHRTEAPGFVFAVQGAAATDVMAVRDPQPFALDSVQDLLRTDVGAWSAHGPLTVGADATLMQDMRVAGATTDRRLFGAEARSTVQRLPGLFGQLAPVPLGLFQLSAEASAVQFESLKAPGIEERTTGFGPTDRGASAAAALPYDASRSPALRFDLAPRVAIAGPASLPVDLRAEAGARLDTWILEGHAGRNRSRAYGLFGASAGLPLERLFGGLLHRIEPQVALRAITRPLQSGGPPIGDLTDAGGANFASAPDAAQQGLGPGVALPVGTSAGVPAARRAYDEIDFAAPLSGAIEATASLLQALWTRPANRVFTFDLQQDFLLWMHGGRARVGEASASAGGQVGPASLGASVRYDWALRDLSALSAGGGARDGRGDEVHASLALLRGSSSERLRAGIDELFSAARYRAAPGGLTGNARVGASTPLPKAGLRAGYDLAWTPGDTPVDFANLYHSATLAYETPCRCAGLLLVLGFPFHDGHLLKDRPDFSFRLDLKSLGSFATF